MVDDQGLFEVWHTQGPIGKPGLTKMLFNGTSFDEATRVFSAKFREKTRNDWSLVARNPEHFQQLPRRYMWLPSVPIEPQQQPRLVSKLNPQVHSLMKLISTNKLVERMAVLMSGKVNHLPLGALSAVTMEKALETLQELSDVIVSSENQPSAAVREIVEELSCRFYSLIPHESHPKLIASMDLVLEKLKLVQELQSSIAIQQEAPAVMVDPLDAQYESLSCDIMPLPEDHPEFEMIAEYLRLTQLADADFSMNLHDAFVVKRQNESERFNSLSEELRANRKLLWHGSRSYNYPNILRNGLQAGVPDAPAAGRYYGFVIVYLYLVHYCNCSKAIYFADISTYSGSFCNPTNDQSLGVLLLAEVALGQPLLVRHTDAQVRQPAPGTHSIFSVGNTVPDPSTHRTFEGMHVPIGFPISSSEHNPIGRLNEYVLHSSDQVRLRYLVRARFDRREPEPRITRA